MEDLRSSAWMHVIDAKTSYNILLGRPWVHENKIVSSSYYQCLKYLEGGIERKIVADDNPFTEVKTHFADAKFYLKSYVVKGAKSNDVKPIMSDKVISKRIDAAVGKVNVDTKELCPILNEWKILSSKKKLTSRLCYVPKVKKEEGQSSNLQENVWRGLTLPIRWIDAINLSSKLPEKSISQNQVRDVALPTKRTREGFDPNAYKLFVKAGYNPDEPSMLGKLVSEDTTRQAHEGLGYSQPPPIRIFIRRASNNHITFEDDVATPNKKPSVFNRLGESTTRTSVFERLGPLKKNKNLRSYLKVTTPISHLVRKDFKSSIPSRMRRRVELVVSCKEELKANVHTVCCHISGNDNDPLEEEDAGDAPSELEEGEKTTIDPLKKVNLGTDEDPRPTYLSAFLEVDEEIAYMNILKKYRDVFAWSYKEIPGLNPKVAVHQLAVKNSSRPVKQAQRRFRPDLVPLIENEVNKLIEAGFIREVKYPNGFQLMIDATTGYETMSFMDGSSGYNQIRMAPKDEKLIAFYTPKGIYCYKVMPFGLKNVGATYQRAMQNIFDDFLHKNVECYVDDLVVKSTKRDDHLKDLRMVFELLRRYQLRMNPLKCAFGVTSGNFLGFIVRHRGIEIDQAKVGAISKMPKPRNIHELKSLQGKLAYLRRFISNLAGRCQPFGHLMKKGASFNWDQTCSDAFKSIKSYLAKPPVLAAPIPGKPLILYIATQQRSEGALLAQENSEARWYLQFQQFEIVYISQKAVKGQTLADFLADYPIPDDWELIDDLPHEDAMSIEIQPPWKMYFDGAAHRGGAGAGAGVFLGSYEVKKPELRPYHDYAQKLIGWIGDLTLQHVRRTENKKADASAALASMLTLPNQTQVTICQRWIVRLPNEEEYIENELEHLVVVSEAIKENWRQPIIDYMCCGILPKNPRRRTDIRCRAPHFLYYKDIVYRISFEGVLLRCLGEEETIQALQEEHS
ncbi:uncharacterized protein LOC125817173 [Solanum verrucosum]|uniref:uncharacterized protein LOC125817173 n=1 Tax=Solanum verrucosum TaxID=315347 RepID=UPI0020D14C48|nr:uncharacterized protein LOC125817173 [Solanum verrucosum]